MDFPQIIRALKMINIKVVIALMIIMVSIPITIFVPEYKKLHVKPDTGKEHKKGVIYYKGGNHDYYLNS